MKFNCNKLEKKILDTFKYKDVFWQVFGEHLYSEKIHGGKFFTADEIKLLAELLDLNGREVQEIFFDVNI